MNLFLFKLNKFFLVLGIFIGLYNCINQKENQYSIEEVNIKLLSILIVKNMECNTQKQISLIYFPIEKNQIDLCVYELFFETCNQWNYNILPESCKNLNINLNN